eukprot:jgi/Mesvir1/21349/Mv20839-RA.1
MLDEDGKALHGTPGPGAYDAPATLGKTQVYRSPPKHSFGARWSQAAMTMPGVTGPETYSPGPAYNQDIEPIARKEPAYSFGTSSKDDDPKRYISSLHTKENFGRDTPGPGAYRARGPKGGKAAEGPAFGFGTALQRMIEESEARHTPGPGSHFSNADLVHTRERRPAYTFAHKGEDRSKYQEEAVFISEMHARTARAGKDSPAPNEYSLKSGLGNLGRSQRHTVDHVHAASAPATPFGKSTRDGERHLFISCVHMEAGNDSPGPIHGVEPLRSSKSTHFGTSQRMHDVELGGSRAGPVIGNSPEFAKPMIGAHSPGPGRYNLADADSDPQLAHHPKFSFGTSKRSQVVSGDSLGWVPGPGAYTPKNSAPGGVSIAPCLRLEVYSTAKDSPGPGAYDVPTDFNRLGNQQRPKTTPTGFGTDTNRSTWRGERTPGPGAYDVDAGGKPRARSPNSKGFSFGLKTYTEVDARGALRKAEAVSSAPGPGAYTMPGGKGISATLGDAATMKFGTGRRMNEKEFLSKELQNPGAASPGPGAYDTSNTDFKYKKKGGYVFGQAKRPPQYTVKF